MDKIISISLAIIFVVRSMTHGLSALLSTMQVLLVSYAKFPPEGALELQFWLFILEQYNGRSIWHSPSAVWLVYSDANNTSYGRYIIIRYVST